MPPFPGSIALGLYDDEAKARRDWNELTQAGALRLASSILIAVGVKSRVREVRMHKADGDASLAVAVAAAIDSSPLPEAAGGLAVDVEEALGPSTTADIRNAVSTGSTVLALVSSEPAAFTRANNILLRANSIHIVTSAVPLPTSLTLPADPDSSDAYAFDYEPPPGTGDPGDPGEPLEDGD